MTDLSKRILSSIEAHGKCTIDGVYKLYPHETKKNIDDAIAELDSLGWIKYRLQMTVDGIKHDIPNVRRSRKQLYSQQTLLDL